jgi:hypothetical protein
MQVQWVWSAVSHLENWSGSDAGGLVEATTLTTFSARVLGTSWVKLRERELWVI